MSPQEAVRLVSRVWGHTKKDNLAHPGLCLGAKAQSWHDIILVAEEIVEDALRRAITSPIQGERARIGRRCAINDAVRKATNYPTQYSIPLYASEAFLLSIATAEAELPAGSKRLVKCPPCCEEHVVPIAVHCSGTKIIADPERNLRFLRRTLLGPVCYVTRDEDRQLDRSKRKGHDRPNRPFLRYKDISPIRRTDNGAVIDIESFSFRDHLRIMEQHPAYATAIPLFASGAKAWRERLIAMRMDEARRIGS